MSHVDDAVLSPMKELFPPPTHLRGRPEALERLLDTYRRALDRFSEPVLKQAWQKVAQEHRFWNWPMASDIVKAAEHFERLCKPQEEWVEKATELTDAYVRRYMKSSSLAVRAREGGFESELRSYITGAAHVQSQYLLGQERVGYVSGVLFPLNPRDKDAEAEFFERARAQAAKGFIQVKPPAALIERWKQAAQGQSLSR